MRRLCGKTVTAERNRGRNTEKERKFAEVRKRLERKPRRCGRRMPALFGTTLLLALCLAGCDAPAESAETGTAGRGTEAGAAAPGRHEVLLQEDAALLDGEETALTDGALVLREAGEYELSGSLRDGRILIAVDGEDSEVLLVLNGVSVRCSDGPALEALQADRLTLSLAEGTENSLHSGGSDMPAPEKDATGAALRTEGSLTLEGSGRLTVEGFINNGIACKKDLRILGGQLKVTAANCGIRANRSLELRDGAVSITAGNDGLCTRSDKLQGDMELSGGSLTVRAGGDGISSSATLLLAGGTAEITTTGDPEIRSSRGIRAEQEIRLTGGEVSVSSTGHALRGGEGVSVSGGSLLLRSSQGKGLAAAGAVRIEGDPVILVEAADNGLETETDLVIAGGSLRVTAGGDGLRAGDSGTGQGTLTVSGGETHVSAGRDALDAKIRMSISGGRLFAAGNSYRLRPFTGEGGQAFLSVKLDAPAEGRFSVRDAGGRELDVLEAEYPADTVHVSAPELVRGESWELQTGEGTVTLTAN